jgi:hypothetical protein
VDVRVGLQAKAGDAVILHRLISVPAAENEVRVDAGSHLTSMLVTIFDASGVLIDQEEQFFGQRIGMQLVGQGVADVLPPPFRAAPASGDLVERRRVHTGAFSIDGGDRSGGFDVMRRNADAFDVLAGRRGWKGESRFFPAGRDPQLEVIRWIKKRIEDPDVVEAFLIDPYLGTEALKRVVLRHGDESVKLTIVVSPADIAPDESTTEATCAAGEHVAHLIKEADALGDKLCGGIEIVHVQRGGGTRQAFHDRYLGLIGRDGKPRVFLLSNSLSKAAGDWPFTVAEVDTPTSWCIAAYVAAVADGNDEGGKQLQAATVWRSGDGIVCASPAQLPQPDAFVSALWTAYTDLSDLNMKGAIGDRSRTDPIVDRLILALPTSFDNQLLAKLLVEGMNERDHFLPAILHRFSATPTLAPVALLVEEALLQRLLERLSPKDGLFGIPEPLSLLRLAGETISRRWKGTDLVRDRMNPLVDAYARSLEIGRVVNGQIKRFTAALSLVLIGLHLVRADGGVPTKFRIGIATDYIRLLGRLLRSSTGRTFLGNDVEEDIVWLEQHAREAIRVARELAADPALKLASIIDFVLSDPLIPPRLLT